MPPIPVPAPGLSSPDNEPPKVPGTFGAVTSDSGLNKVPITFGIPPAPPLAPPTPSLSNPGDSSPKVPGTFGAAPPPPPTSNPGLSAPSDPAFGAVAGRGFGAPNFPPNAASWGDNTSPLTALPDDPKIEPVAGRREEPTRIRAPLESLVGPPVLTQPAADPKRKQTTLIAIVAAVVVLVIGIVVVASSSTDSPDKPTPNAGNSSAPTVGLPASSEPASEAAAAASGSALTPDEIAAAVPDETPVETVANEPPTPTPLATHTQKSNWKPIAKGQARLLIKATGGVCKITINATYYGVTPLDVMVDAGKLRVFCRTSTGSTRSKELRAAEYRLTMIEFNLKP
jgi:eukaryotic-like serine/threonine-protein kinase